MLETESVSASGRLTQRQGWGYSITALDNFLLTLFEKYAELLKRRFSDDFQEVRAILSKLFSLLTRRQDRVH